MCCCDGCYYWLEVNGCVELILDGYVSIFFGVLIDIEGWCVVEVECDCVLVVLCVFNDMLEQCVQECINVLFEVEEVLCQV